MCRKRGPQGPRVRLCRARGARRSCRPAPLPGRADRIRRTRQTCRIVRLADVGWTAETATTAVFAQILTELGYQPQTTVLSVPVTFESMKNGDMDVFLGNWMPAQSADAEAVTPTKARSTSCAPT